MLVEADIAEGVIAVPLSNYAAYPTRICRPVGLSSTDCARVVEFMLAAVGLEYNLDNVIDRARFHDSASNTVTDALELRRLISDARTQVWTCSESETVDGAAAVAAPVTDPAGRVIAALSLYASADRLNHMTSFAAELVAAAREAGTEWDAISAFPSGLTVQHDVQSAS